jgi:DNA polymerase-1
MGHRVLAESEYEGLTIDRPYLKNLVTVYGKKIARLDKKLRNHKRIIKYNRSMLKAHKMKLLTQVENEIEALLEKGHEPGDKVIRNREEKISRYMSGVFTTNKEKFEGINFNSPKQMGDLFFNSKYGFKFKPVKQTKSGGDSTDEEVLEILKPKDKSGFISDLLENRGLTKLYSTYIKGMYDKLGDDNKIHGSFLLHGTVTGRLSSREPNLQNIPRTLTNADIKPMFIPPPGYLLMEVDYSQAELRVVAELANETAMIDIFKRGYNIHVATACKANGVLDKYIEINKILKDPTHPDNEFWERQKKRAKLLNFGILYGQTKKKLSIELECTEEEAQIFINEWFAGFPKIERWIKKQHALAKKQGYVRNLFGRKRRLDDIYSDHFGKFLEAQRQSVNAPIQGTASDFTLFSTIIIREEKQKYNLPGDMPQVYTVHDSIGFYIRPELIHQTVPKIIEICANPQTRQWFGFSMTKVNMKVSPEIGKTWGGLEDYSPTTDYTTWLDPKAEKTILLY